MEEGGHYYTVYYTSLAVGFNEKIAYRHALLSQMPDEVGWLDAANLHIDQCTFQSERNLNGVTQGIPPNWRYAVEYGLHSLPGKSLNANTRSSAYQRQQTTLALAKEDAASLQFGLLLHRLGDTYAHSKIGNPATMYTVSGTDEWACVANPLTSIGHGHRNHDPDYPFLRPLLFFSYVENLYTVLYNKLQEASSKNYRRGVPARPYHQVENDFKHVFTQLEKAVQDAYRLANDSIPAAGRMNGARAAQIDKEQKAKWLIDYIRAATYGNLKVHMNPYKPEEQEGLTLAQFLAQHPELSELNINRNSIEQAVSNAIPSEATPPPTMYEKALEGAGWVDNEIRKIYRLPHY
jgi:hypothetical protein